MCSFIRAFNYKPEVTVQIGFHSLGMLRSKAAWIHTTWQVLQNSNVSFRQLHMSIIRCLTNQIKKSSWIIRLFKIFYFSNLYLQCWKEQWTLFLINQLKKIWSHYIPPKNTWPAFTVSIILGDPGADSGSEGKSKRAEKCGTKKSKEGREEPLGTMSYQTSSVPNGCPRSGFWLVPKTCVFLAPLSALGSPRMASPW